MKKIFKIFLVSLIAINFVFTNQVKVKAIDYKFLPWSVSFYTANHSTSTYKNYTGEWMTEEKFNNDIVAWGTTIDPGQAIYKYIMKFRFDEGVKPGETVTITFSYEITGFYPITQASYYLQMYASVDGSITDIEEPIEGANCKTSALLNESANGYVSHYVEEYKFTNTFNKTVNELFVVQNFNEARNVLSVLTKVFQNSYYITKSKDLMDEENNTNIGGIFETVKKIFTGITNLPTNIANSVKGFFDNIVNAVNKIQTWLVNLLDGIIQGLKSLFIPSDDYFKNYFDSLYDFFSEKLGILIMPIDILVSLFENIMNLDNGDGYIHVPNFEFMGVNLIPKTDYNLKVDVEKVLGNYYDMYYLLTDVIIYFMLFNMAKKKFETIVGGTSE